MPPDLLDFRRRARLVELMDGPCTREQLRACLRDLARVNRMLLAYGPVLQWLDSLDLHEMDQPVRILDVGFGYGDVPRRIEQWARTRGIAAEMTAIDLNPDTVLIAAEATDTGSAIEWVHSDVFDYAPQVPPHVVISSLFTHHLEDTQVVRFLQWMERNAIVGWFIGDLLRSAISYRLFRALARGAGLHPFVQNDGPISIARAFVPEDWRRMCAEAGLREPEVTIRGHWPGKLCVMRRKPALS